MSRLKSFLPLLFLVAIAHAQNPALPTIPANTFYVTNYGAIADGITTNTAAIQNAINAANSAGGGTVRITPGVFLSGPFTFVNNLNLQLDSGATLKMLPYDQYPGGVVSPANFIQGTSLHDVEISGLGAIEGQGLPWWESYNTNNANVRPNMVNLSACTRVLIQDVTCSNSPSPFLVIKGKAGNVTIQRVKVYAPSSGASPPSHNTDAIDLAETNAVIRDCIISTGDDNVAVGSSGSASYDIIITNCTMGFGHGVSIGSFTSGGVSNMTVVNCTFTNTDQGIRIKSDRDRGGIVQNINYYNLAMGNVQYPILIYGYYTNKLIGTNALNLNNLTPSLAALSQTFPVTNKTPIFRDITISNVVGSAQSTRMVGLIWGLPEMLITNLTLNKVTLTGSKSLGIYFADGLKLIDSQINVPVGVNPVSFFDARIIYTNSAPSSTVVTLDGVSTNSIGNNLAFYNALASLKNTNALDIAPVVTLSASTFTISNHLDLDAASQFNFVLGTNAATMVVRSNLALNGTINVSAGAGFTNTNYTLFTYGNGLVWSAPTLGSKPPDYNYAWDTNTVGQVRLIVSAIPPSNTPPVLAAISNRTAIAGTTVTFTNSASDVDVPAQTLTYLLLNGPTNATLNSSNGIFSWRPLISQSPTTNPMSVVVSDSGTPSLSATQNFTVTVTRPAQPNIQSISLTSGTFQFQVTGDGGPDYIVQASTNLVDWTGLFTTNYPALPFDWSDPNVAIFNQRFFRILLGP